MKRYLPFLLVCAILIASTFFGASNQAFARPNLTFFTELESTELKALATNSTVVSDLRALHASVSIGLLDLSKDRAESVRAFNSVDIPVTAWILMEKSDGYWANLGNLPAVRQRVTAFKRWANENHLRFDRVGLDIEPDIRTMQGGMTGIAATIFSGVISSGATLPSPMALSSAEQGYMDLIAEIKSAGWPVESYTIPVITDERLAGSNILRRSLGIVDVSTDREVPMLYSSVIPHVGAGFLESYAQSGPLDAIGIGVTGGGVSVGSSAANMTWSEFTHDLLVASSHAEHVYVFSLEGCVHQGWLSALNTFDWSAEADSAFFQMISVDAARAALSAGLAASPKD